MKKFELTAEFKMLFGVKLFRIRALVDFGYIKAGELGGWIKSENNLSQSGNAWVYGDAEVYGNAKDTLWTQATKNGKVTFKNPLLQAEAEARMLREVLFAAKLKNVPVETLCVFPNNATELAVPRSTPVYRLKEFSALLKKDHFTEDRKVDIDKVAKALRDAMED